MQNVLHRLESLSLAVVKHSATRGNNPSNTTQALDVIGADPEGGSDESVSESDMGEVLLQAGLSPMQKKYLQTLINCKETWMDSNFKEHISILNTLETQFNEVVEDFKNLETRDLDEMLLTYPDPGLEPLDNAQNWFSAHMEQYFANKRLLSKKQSEKINLQLDMLEEFGEQSIELARLCKTLMPNFELVRHMLYTDPEKVDCNAIRLLLKKKRLYTSASRFITVPIFEFEISVRDKIIKHRSIKEFERFQEKLLQISKVTKKNGAFSGLLRKRMEEYKKMIEPYAGEYEERILEDIPLNHEGLKKMLYYGHMIMMDFSSQEYKWIKVGVLPEVTQKGGKEYTLEMRLAKQDSKLLYTQSIEGSYKESQEMIYLHTPYFYAQGKSKKSLDLPYFSAQHPYHNLLYHGYQMPEKLKHMREHNPYNTSTPSSDANLLGLSIGPGKQFNFDELMDDLSDNNDRIVLPTNEAFEVSVHFVNEEKATRKLFALRLRVLSENVLVNEFQMNVADLNEKVKWIATPKTKEDRSDIIAVEEEFLRNVPDQGTVIWQTKSSKFV